MTRKGINLVDVLYQLLGNQVTGLVQETAATLAEHSNKDTLWWEQRLYSGLADNLKTKAELFRSSANPPGDEHC
jgi:hypothetical protein